jgi:hypothetical protein
MENLPASDQASVSSPSVAKQLKNSKWLFIVLGVVILVLIGEGIYWLKLKEEEERFVSETSQQNEAKTLSSEQQLKEDIIRIFEPYGGEQSESCQSILRSLEEAKEYDPQKFPENLQQYGAYTDAIGVLVGIYFASGDSPENRNQEVLKVLAQIRELARSSPYFDEEQWKVEGVDSY